VVVERGIRSVRHVGVEQGVFGLLEEQGVLLHVWAIGQRERLQREEVALAIGDVHRLVAPLQAVDLVAHLGLEVDVVREPAPGRGAARRIKHLGW